MNKEQLIALFQNRKLKIAFDTNALFNVTRFFNICDTIDRLNKEFQFEFKIIIPTLAHFEKLYDLRQEKQEQYCYQQIMDILEEKQVHIMSFEPIHAEAVAELLYTRYPTKEKWLQAKIERCANCLATEREIPIGKNTKCSATIDWLIAGYAVAESCLLITCDGGIEFERDVNKKTTLEIFEQAIRELWVDKI